MRPLDDWNPLGGHNGSDCRYDWAKSVLALVCVSARADVWRGACIVTATRRSGGASRPSDCISCPPASQYRVRLWKAGHTLSYQSGKETAATAAGAYSDLSSFFEASRAFPARSLAAIEERSGRSSDLGVHAAPRPQPFRSRHTTHYAMSAVPRILMLPGWTQSASIYRGRMGAVRKAIGDQAELVFLDPVSVAFP